MRHVDVVINLLNDLAFHISFEKSSIGSFHTLVHLSYIWNSSDMSISLPSDKIMQTKKFAYYPIHYAISITKNRGMIIAILVFHLMKILWMTCLGGLLVLIVSPLSVSYHFPHTSPYILTYVGKVGKLTSFQSSRQPGTWPPGFDYQNNYLELLTIYYGLLALLLHVKDCSITLRLKTAKQ